MPALLGRRQPLLDGGTGQNPATVAGLLALAPPGRLNSINPILPYLGPAPGWQSGQTFEQVVLVDPHNAARLLMYYCGQRNGGIGGGIGRCTASAAAPTVWTPYAGNPLMTAIGDESAGKAWYSDQIRLDSVIYDPVADQIRLYTTGRNLLTGHDSVGLWTSPGTDGVAFTQNAGNPIWTPAQATGIGGVTVTDVSQLCVYRFDATHWYGYYCHRGSDGVLPNIRLCTSSDGIAWTDTATVAWTKLGTYDSVYVEGKNQILALDQYVLITSSFDGTHWVCAAGTSPALTGAFTPLATPIFKASGVPGTYDETLVSCPSIYNLNGKWYLFYCGTNQPLGSNYNVAYWSSGMALF